VLPCLFAFVLVSLFTFSPPLVSFSLLVVVCGCVSRLELAIVSMGRPWWWQARSRGTLTWCLISTCGFSRCVRTEARHGRHPALWRSRHFVLVSISHGMSWLGCLQQFAKHGTVILLQCVVEHHPPARTAVPRRCALFLVELCVGCGYAAVVQKRGVRRGGVARHAVMKLPHMAARMLQRSRMRSVRPHSNVCMWSNDQVVKRGTSLAALRNPVFPVAIVRGRSGHL